MGSGYGRVGRALDRLVSFRGAPIADPRLGDGSARLSAFDDVQDRSSALMAHALCPPPRRRCATGCRSAMFHGLPLDVETPDHASIWRFRQTIDKLGLSPRLLAKVNRQLDARGLVIKRGKPVDDPSSPHRDQPAAPNRWAPRSRESLEPFELLHERAGQPLCRAADDKPANQVRRE
jgi:hypothetical protein